MVTDVLDPVKSFPLPVGKEIKYANQTISRFDEGRLVVNDSQPQVIVSFSLHRGLAEYRCFAAIKNDRVYFFEGATIGASMITQEQVKEALSLV